MWSGRRYPGTCWGSSSSPRSPLTNRKPPRMTSGATTSRLVRRVCRVEAAWLTAQGSPDREGLVFWASAAHRSISSRSQAGEHHDALTYVSLARRSSRSGRFLRGDQNDPVARSISSSSPRSSALRSAHEFLTPFRPVGQTIGILFASPVDFPPVLHPEGLRFPGVLLGWLAHSPHHTTSDPSKQEMRNSRNRENLRSSSACSSGRRSRFRCHAGGGYDDMGESEASIFSTGKP
jgi:hypothetical protein